LTVVCHVWPSISPWNVWDLPWHVWVMFARQADEWVKARTEEA
jgi:hypothetical protein